MAVRIAPFHVSAAASFGNEWPALLECASPAPDRPPRFRGLPILVTVFIVFFGLPAINHALEFAPLNAAAIALVLWGSAQVAEATRGAVQSIPREQHEALQPPMRGQRPHGPLYRKRQQRRGEHR